MIHCTKIEQNKTVGVSRKSATGLYYSLEDECNIQLCVTGKFPDSGELVENLGSGYSAIERIDEAFRGDGCRCRGLGN